MAFGGRHGAEMAYFAFLVVTDSLVIVHRVGLQSDEADGVPIIWETVSERLSMVPSKVCVSWSFEVP